MQFKNTNFSNPHMCCLGYDGYSHDDKSDNTSDGQFPFIFNRCITIYIGRF